MIVIPEGEEYEQDTENLFEKVMMENFPNLTREKVTEVQELYLLWRRTDHSNMTRES